MTKIHIVGTAHVSQKSINEVRDAVNTVNPDVIAIELDPERFAVLKRQMKETRDTTNESISVSEKHGALEVKELLKGDLTLILVQWVLAYLQRKIGMSVGVEPGADMKEAIQLAEKHNIHLMLIDRDIRITFSRFWSEMKIREKITLIMILIQSLFITNDKTERTAHKIDNDSIDELTNPDIIKRALEEFHTFSPNGSKALIDERDAYLAHSVIKLEQSSYERAVVVVGAGHVPGINRFREDPSALPPLEDLLSKPKSYSWGKISSCLFMVILGIILFIIAFSGAADILIWAIVYWILLHALFAGFATLISRGHPLSAAIAAMISWITPMNPFLAVGWVAAIVEARIRPPATEDLNSISQAKSIGELLTIPLFHILIVAAMANIGNALATICFFLFLTPLLGVDLNMMTQILWDGLSNLWHCLIT
ncbi:MAG TPA: TraB/GumN family protein [Methanocorpusculum sp.]|nr:TraB/GumN family protein [Methanocorpusculum sp.]